MSSLWACRNCASVFAEPSFSEGPKVVDQQTGAVKRFTESRLICPVCFSPRLIAPDSLRVSRDATLRSNFAGVKK